MYITMLIASRSTMDYKGGHECKKFHEGDRDSDIKGSGIIGGYQQQAPRCLHSGFPTLPPKLMTAYLAK